MIDVYVDHTDLDEAISQAESAGLTIVHDNSVVLTGDADATVVNTKTATDYYKTKETEIKQATAKYKADLLNYEAEQKRNDQDAANANAIMVSLRTNLAINKQTVVTETKPYSAQALEADTLLNLYAKENKIEVTDQELKDEVENIKEKNKGLQRMKDIVERNSNRLVPKWIDMNKDTLEGKIIALADREDIDFPVEEHLIVEYYSK